MSKVGEEVIFSAECLTRFFRLPIVHDGVNFFVNTGRNSVSCIQASDQKLLQTWTVKHPHSFTAPVVFAATDSTLSCVMDKDVIVTWPSVAEDLSTSGKVKLKHPVYALLPIENGCIVVVLCNGTVCLIEQAGKLKKSDVILDKNEELVYTGAVLCSNDVIVANLVQHKKTHQYRLITYVLKSSTQKFQHVLSQHISHSDFSLKSWCLFSGTHCPSLLTLWSDGEIHKSSLLEEVSGPLFTLSGISAETSAAIDLLGSEHLVVAKTSTSASKKEFSLEIWDLNYCVLKANKILKHSLTKSIQLKAFDSSVFITSREGIVMLSVKVEASTLSSALGKAKAFSAGDQGKVYLWTSEGKLKSKGKKALEDQKSLLFSMEKLTSKKFQETVENLSEEKLENLCNELSERKDIMEEEIVKILQIFLRMRNVQINGDAMEVDSSKIMCSKNKLLNAVFKIPFSDIFLIRHLKRLDFEETVMALNFLHGVLESQLFAGKEKQRPSDLQIVNWIEILTQSHYDELVTSKDTRVLILLEKLQLSLREKMEVYIELQEIECLLSVLTKKCPLPERVNSEKYRVTTLFL